MARGQDGKGLGRRAFGLILALSSWTRALVAQDAVSAGHAATSDAVIRIEVLTGSLRVTAWERDSVAVTGRVDLRAGRFSLTGTSDAIRLGVELPPGQEPDGTSDLEVRVPGSARLWIRSAAADVEITATGGSIAVNATSGRVRIGGRVREAAVETLDGNTELALQGDVARARSASGTIVVRGVIRDLDASSVSGPLLIGMEGDGARIRLETVSSEIAFKGGLVADGRLEAQTHAGDIELRLPPTLGVAYHMVSYGGGLHNELVPPAAVRRGPNKGEFLVTTGDGRATVDVRTFKGTVTIKARGPERY